TGANLDKVSNRAAWMLEPVMLATARRRSPCLWQGSECLKTCDAVLPVDIEHDHPADGAGHNSDVDCVAKPLSEFILCRQTSLERLPPHERFLPAQLDRDNGQASIEVIASHGIVAAH